MTANLKVFGNMSMKEANSYLKNNLKDIKLQSEELLETMDLLFGRFQLDPDEFNKWNQLRQSILNFRTLDVSPVMKQNMESL